LLELFFASHDPTTLNRQGNDVGTQYRSAIFYTSQSQREQAHTMISELTAKAVYDQSIVTEVTASDVFYEAEIEHHNYYNNHSNQIYCQLVIQPKVTKVEGRYNNLLKKIKDL